MLASMHVGLGRPGPIEKTACHLVKRAPVAAKASSRSWRPSRPSVIVSWGKRAKRRDPFVHLDSGDDALVIEQLDEGSAVGSHLCDGFLEEDHATQILTDAWGSEQEVSVRTASFLGEQDRRLRTGAQWWKSSHRQRGFPCPEQPGLVRWRPTGHG